jgi:hypothetical protein
VQTALPGQPEHSSFGQQSQELAGAAVAVGRQITGSGDEGCVVGCSLPCTPDPPRVLSQSQHGEVLMGGAALPPTAAAAGATDHGHD